ncbi:MAG: RNA polymerase sigma factor (sigma-70 family) [Maribacter sp.]|jgi:RNA polymerase sigma factor (sigma-70 family)
MLFRKKTYTDHDLVAGCSKNDRQYQEILYRKYFPKAMGLIMYHVKDKEKSLDIVNQGFLKVFQKIDTIKDAQALEAWIKTIMMRTRSDYFRKDAKYLKAVILEEPRQERSENTTLNDLYFNDIIRLLDKLPPATAEVFRLYAVEGYKHKEIGERLGISEGTSKWHLSAARQKLKELIKEYYDTQRDVG